MRIENLPNWLLAASDPHELVINNGPATQRQRRWSPPRRAKRRTKAGEDVSRSVDSGTALEPSDDCASAPRLPVDYQHDLNIAEERLSRAPFHLASANGPLMPTFSKNSWATHPSVCL